MNRLMIAAALVSGFCGLVGEAKAMPVSGASAGAPAIELVAGGCGIGFHRGPYGGCRPNAYYRRPVYGPRCFWRRGPYGAMRRVCIY